MMTWKCEVAIANDSGASHITKAIVSITVEETRLQKNKVLRMMISKKEGAEAPWFIELLLLDMLATRISHKDYPRASDGFRFPA